MCSVSFSITIYQDRIPIFLHLCSLRTGTLLIVVTFFLIWIPYGHVWIPLIFYLFISVLRCVCYYFALTCIHRFSSSYPLVVTGKSSCVLLNQTVEFIDENQPIRRSKLFSAGLFQHVSYDQCNMTASYC